MKGKQSGRTLRSSAHLGFATQLVGATHLTTMRVNPTFRRAKPGGRSLWRERLGTLPTLAHQRFALCADQPGLQVSAVALSVHPLLMLALAAQLAPARTGARFTLAASFASEHVHGGYSPLLNDSDSVTPGTDRCNVFHPFGHNPSLLVIGHCASRDPRSTRAVQICMRSIVSDAKRPRVKRGLAGPHSLRPSSSLVGLDGTVAGERKTPPQNSPYSQNGPAPNRDAIEDSGVGYPKTTRFRH